MAKGIAEENTEEILVGIALKLSKLMAKKDS